MGPRVSKLPPIQDRDLRTVLSFNLHERHLRRLWRRFLEVDVHLSGVWTIEEAYSVIQEPRMSMRSPVIDAIFFMADSQGEGTVGFQDFLVSFCCFCALSKQEVLQLLFIIIDKDRSGSVEKAELQEFFSYVPAGTGHHRSPLFPVNNKNALDKFRGGKWSSLAFDGLAQVCESFPYIAYPAYHVQEMYREKLLGKSFWEKLDINRMIPPDMQPKKRMVRLPITKMKIEVTPPGVCSMAEFLEYSRRKTGVQGGKRVFEEAASSQTVLAKARDEQISRAPLLNMIRNPRCMYHVPHKPSENAVAMYKRAASEVQMKQERRPGSLRGITRPATTETEDEESGTSSDGSSSED
mmetsp:Transcript_29801/g.64956  ORF Transcript_29801/g.64956 Transcript_29801/m.64956 type:complete len:351 (-) Transcript_29801:450-1502(-)